MALNAAAIDTRIKASVTSTMYDMTRVNAKGYFDDEDSEEDRHKKRAALNAQRTEDYKNGTYALAGGVVDPLPDDAPFFVKDYYDYYKTDRGYHPRSLNSNGGWNVTSTLSFSICRYCSTRMKYEAQLCLFTGKRPIPAISAEMPTPCSQETTRS